MIPPQTPVHSYEKLNYKLLTKNMLYFSQLLGTFIVNIETLRIIKSQLIYNCFTLCITMYHIYLTPDLFVNMHIKLGEFNSNQNMFHSILANSFAIIVDVTAMLSKITVYRMKIYLSNFYDYLYLSDMYINFNKVVAKVNKIDNRKQNHEVSEEQVRYNYLKFTLIVLSNRNFDTIYHLHNILPNIMS